LLGHESRGACQFLGSYLQVERRVRGNPTFLVMSHGDISGEGMEEGWREVREKGWALGQAQVRW